MNAFRNTYQYKFSIYSLNRLISDYYIIEHNLINDIDTFTKSYFRNLSSALSDDNVYYINGLLIELFFSLNTTQREYTILLADKFRKTEKLKEPIVVSVFEFGKLNRIVVECPSNIASIANKFVMEIKELIKDYYMNYENELITKFSDNSNILCQTLYQMINIEFEKRNKSKLIENTYLTVTDIGRSSLFRFNLDVKNLKPLVKKLKVNQDEILSPAEILLCIITEDVPDDGLELYKDGMHEVIMEFDKMDKLKSGYVSYLQSEKLFFSDPKIGFKYISSYKNQLLALNYPGEMSVEAFDTIREFQDKIDEAFAWNLNKYNKLVKIVDKNKMTNNEIIEFVQNIIAKIIVESSKG